MIATIRKNIIITPLQPEEDFEFDEFDKVDVLDELFLFADTFEKIFIFEFVLLFAALLLFPFPLLFVENCIKLFAIGATEFSVLVATELRAPGILVVAKFVTEFIADRPALETELRAPGTVLVANDDSEFRAEFAALFVALVRLDTVFIAELSTMLSQK